MARTPSPTLTKGSRITGEQREALTTELVRRYTEGESIRAIADSTGRSYGFVHGVLKESGTPLRGRGGATRGNGVDRKAMPTSHRKAMPTSQRKAMPTLGADAAPPAETGTAGPGKSVKKAGKKAAARAEGKDKKPAKKSGKKGAKKG